MLQEKVLETLARYDNKKQKAPVIVELLKIHISFSFQQEFEALHSDFKPTWQRFKRGMENENYGRKFLRAVVVYNSEDLK